MRRGILRGVDLDGSVAQIMQTSPTVVREGSRDREVRRLIRERWRTRLTVTTDDQGLARFDGFHGRYELRAGDVEAEMSLRASGLNMTTVRLPRLAGNTNDIRKRLPLCLSMPRTNPLEPQVASILVEERNGDSRPLRTTQRGIKPLCHHAAADP